jgi:hypothetical protein
LTSKYLTIVVLRGIEQALILMPLVYIVSCFVPLFLITGFLAPAAGFQTGGTRRGMNMREELRTREF